MCICFDTPFLYSVCSSLFEISLSSELTSFRWAGRTYQKMFIYSLIKEMPPEISKSICAFHTLTSESDPKTLITDMETNNSVNDKSIFIALSSKARQTIPLPFNWCAGDIDVQWADINGDGLADMICHTLDRVTALFAPNFDVEHVIVEETTCSAS